MSEAIEVKAQGPIPVICRRVDLTFEEFDRIPEFAGEALPQLYNYLAELGAGPAGPNIFEYHFQDNPHGPRRIVNGRFMLTIAVPVAAPLDSSPPIEAAHLPEFKYVEIVTNSFGDEWRSRTAMSGVSLSERSTARGTGSVQRTRKSRCRSAFGNALVSGSILNLVVGDHHTNSTVAPEPRRGFSFQQSRLWVSKDARGWLLSGYCRSCCQSDELSIIGRHEAVSPPPGSGCRVVPETHP